MCSTFFGPTSLSFMLYPCEEVTVNGFIHDRQLGCLIWRRDTLTCGKQSDFLPATVALMLVITMFFLHWGLGTQSSAKYTSPVDPRPFCLWKLFISCLHLRVPTPSSHTPSSVGQMTASASIPNLATWSPPRSWTGRGVQNTPSWCAQMTGNSRRTWGWTSPSRTSMTTRPSFPVLHIHLTSLKTWHQVRCWSCWELKQKCIQT